MKDHRYEPGAGENINKTAKRMAEIAKRLNVTVLASFNEIALSAKPGADPMDIVANYHHESERRAEEYRNSPEGQQAERDREEYQRRAAAAAAEGIKPFEITDQEAWDKTVKNNDDEYGACAVRYAARWAHMMEAKIASGASLTDIAERASHEADLEGITGFMYGCAVGILAKVWKHGEELRRWHNTNTQIGNEGEKANETGGVLNPALLRIG